MTDYDTGLAPASGSELDSGFMMFASFDSNDTTESNNLSSACGDLSYEAEFNTGLLSMPIKYENNKYKLYYVVDAAKSNYFIWTVTSVDYSVLITL